MYKFVCPSATYRWTRNVLTADYVMLGEAKVHHQQQYYSRAGNGKNSFLIYIIIRAFDLHLSTWLPFSDAEV